MQKNEFEKIGVHVIKPYKKNGHWFFDKDGRTYDMAPAEIVEMTLSPMVYGVDRLIQNACLIKKIDVVENGFLLLFSAEYFPNADVKFTYVEPKLDGFVYEVKELNMMGIPSYQSAWICKDILRYFQQPPQNLFIKIERSE